MGKVETIQIWPISSAEKLTEGSYSAKVLYCWHIKNSKNKPVFRKGVRKKNVYDKFMQIRN